MKDRPNEPTPNPDAHLSLDELSKRLERPHICTKKLTNIVHRKEDGSREMVRTCILDVDRGVIGDRWELHEKRQKWEQIAVMSTMVAETIANGQSLELFGDNLFIDEDFGETHFTVGSRW